MKQPVQHPDAARFRQNARNVVDAVREHARVLDDGARRLNWEYRFWDIALKHAIDIGQETGTKRLVRGIVSTKFKGQRRWVIEPVKPMRPTCERCANALSVGACCSSHLKELCHGCYRRTHFVEVCVKGCRECAKENLPEVM